MNNKNHSSVSPYSEKISRHMLNRESSIILQSGCNPQSVAEVCFTGDVVAARDRKSVGGITTNIDPVGVVWWSCGHTPGGSRVSPRLHDCCQTRTRLEKETVHVLANRRQSNAVEKPSLAQNKVSISWFIQGEHQYWKSEPLGIFSGCVSHQTKSHPESRGFGNRSSPFRFSKLIGRKVLRRDSESSIRYL